VGTDTPEGRSPRATVLRDGQRRATTKYAVSSYTASPVATQSALYMTVFLSKF